MSADKKDLVEEQTREANVAEQADVDQVDVIFNDDHLEIRLTSEQTLAAGRKFVAYTVKLPSEQLAALQSIWLELKRLYGTHSPDKSGMIQQAIAEWLHKWEGPEKAQLLQELLEIRENTRRRQYRK